MHKLKLLATACAIAALVAASGARADVTYDWTLGSGTGGTFTTGAAAPSPPIDSGYFLLTSFTITSFTDITLGPLPVSGLAESGGFATDASYNPAANTFEDIVGTTLFNDTGSFLLTGSLDGISGLDSIEGLAPPAADLIIIDPTTDQFVASGNFVITPETTPAPEPVTLSLFGSGLAAIALRRRPAKTV